MGELSGIWSLVLGRLKTLLVGSFEVLLESGELGARLLQLVNRNGIRHCLNKTAVFARGDDVERLEPKLEAVLDEDVFEL